jgi:UDP-glucose 4-epimerase
MRRVAVTGTHGFLGRVLYDALCRNLDRVVPIRRRESGSGTLYEALPSCDVLYHAGGGSTVAAAMENPLGDLRAHVHSLVEILEAARRGTVGTVVLASSAAVYGDFDGMVTESTPRRPVSAYGASKLSAEIYLETYCRQFGLDGRIARIANPYGPGQRKYVIFDLVHRALTAQPPLRLRGTGTEIRDFVFVDDAVAALIAVGERGARLNAYNIGSGEPVALRTVASLVASAAALQPDAVQVDGDGEPGKIKSFYCSTDKIHALGWVPQTSLELGIAATVRWVREEMACAP